MHVFSIPFPYSENSELTVRTSWRGLFITAMFLSFCTPVGSQENSSADILIKNVDIISMVDGQILENHHVVIHRGVISGIKNNIDEDISAELIIDGTGKYLVPGISEMHAHVPTPNEGDDSYVREVLFLYLSNGITTIRGMLGQPYHLELKEKIKSGEILSPRLYTSSPSMNGNSVQSPEEAERKVRQYKSDGYDFLKMHPGLTLDNFNALVKTAHEVDMDFAGHVSIDVGVKRCLEAEYATIDHLDGYVEAMLKDNSGMEPNQNGFFGYNFTPLADESKLPPLCELTKSKNVWIVPTHSLMVNVASERSAIEMSNDPEMKYVSSSTLIGWRNGKQRMLDDESFDKEKARNFLELRDKILRDLHEAGVPILLGSDAPQVFNVPGFSIQKEMQAMAKAGLTPLEILQSGTVNPAKFFQSENRFGTIREGLSADMILLNANPLEDIQNMQQIDGVMVRGEWLSREKMNKKLSEIEKKYKS